MRSNFFVTVPYWNSRWIEQCLDSIRLQTYPHFRVVIVDDASTDGSYDKTLAWLKKADDNRFSIIRNKVNVGSTTGGYIKAIDSAKLDGEDIIVTVDGDDWLSDNGVFEHLDNVYNSKKALMTYGQFMPVGGEYSQPCAKVPDTATYRKSGLWQGRSYASHLRTFKKKVFDKINRKDFIDPHDKTKYIQAGSDMPLIFGLLEICGNERSVFIDRVMYIYNNHNRLSIMYKNPKVQKSNAKVISRRPVYERYEFKD